MNEFTHMRALINDVSNRMEAYYNKPTKAESGRIRKLLGDIKKCVTAVRTELVEADKA